MNKPEFVYVSYIATTPEKLWEALTSSEFTKQYWNGRTIHSDWKVGSPVKLLKANGAVDWIGEILQANPPHLLSYTFDPQSFLNQGKTMLHFRHSKWREDAKAFPHCSMGWAVFLLSLKEFVETGKGRPHPYDMPVKMWTPPTEAVC